MAQVSMQFYEDHRIIGRCVSSIKAAQEILVERGKRAAKLLRETGAQHVLYGCKIYSGDTLVAVQLYMIPMDDAEFERVTGKANQVIVYAIHRHGEAV
nr:hypothetical protein [uncultured Blautia sp.]